MNSQHGAYQVFIMPLEMNELHFADDPNKRCHGAPAEGSWGNLANEHEDEFKWATITTVSEDACKKACFEKPTCLFAVYRVDNGHCTEFDSCDTSKVDDNGTWTVWAKQQAPRPSCGLIEENYDYPGRDIVSYKALTADACCSLCIENAQCESWTWGKKRGEVYSDTCFLKNALPIWPYGTRTKNDCCISGYARPDRRRRSRRRRCTNPYPWESRRRSCPN